MNQRKFSIRDIAQEAKVSSATVSRVFAGSAHVSAETQALVLKIAQEHGYEPKVYQKRQHRILEFGIYRICYHDFHAYLRYQLCACISGYTRRNKKDFR